MNLPDHPNSQPIQEFPSEAAFRHLKMITAIQECFAQESKIDNWDKVSKNIPRHNVPERRRRLQIAIEETACLLGHLQNAASVWDQADTRKAQVDANVGLIVEQVNEQLATIKS